MNKVKSARQIRFYMDTGEWGFLSPMYPCPIKIKGVEYGSAEHYYQSMKAADQAKREWIRCSATGYEAKDRAHELKQEETVKKSPEKKIATMREAFLAKFAQNPELAAKLLDTGDAQLLEESIDPFWGEKGENWIGRLAMEARASVRKRKT